jgi:Mn2+/Fe2+ NRAMP family transporter
MKKLTQITLGILTAIGGFVDIGDLVANALTGARFGMSLAWVVIVGVIGIILFAEMSGRVATVTGRPVFDLVRERLGVRAGLANLFASFFINFLTLCAEIGGVALALELATSVNYLLWVPIVAVLLWVTIWKIKFESMERIYGLLGLCLIVFAVALWKLGPDWGSLWTSASDPTVPQGEGHPTWIYYGIALFGAAMTPYEVFFFSSGAVEERWTKKDLMLNRANVYIGFPLGAALSLAIMACTATLFQPRGVSVDTLSQVGMPVSVALGKVGLAIVLVGFFAATFGAAIETLMSSGYTVAQYFGWQWGKYVAPKKASRFHVVLLVTLLLATVVSLTTIDPVKVTEYSIVLSAAALPLTYLPILVVANDKEFMGDKTNSKVSNALASVYLVIIMVVAVVTIPLMIATKAGA